MRSSTNDSIKCHILGRLAYYETDPNEIKKYSIELLNLAEQLNNQIGIYNGYFYLGLSEKYLGNFSESLEAFFNCLKLSKKISIQANSEVLIAIADVYSRNGDYRNATVYYSLAISTLHEIVNPNERDMQTLGTAYLNAGDAYFMSNELDSALAFSLNSKKILERVDREAAKVGLAYCTGNIGLILASRGDDKLAEESIIESIKSLEILHDFYAISVYNTYMADIYKKRNDLKRALKYAHKSHQMALDYNLKEQVRDASLKLYELYKVAENYSEALKYHEEFSFYKDSITNMESVKEMANLRTEFEVGQKQAEVDLLTAEKKIQQLMLIAAIGFSLIVIILAAIIYKYYRDKNKVARILQLQKVELERLNHTKDKFFSIISHDLRGPVASFFGISRMIKFLVKSKETDQLLEIADDIDQSVERLSSLLDNLLNWAMQQQGHVPNVPEKLEFKYLAMDLSATFKTMADSKKINLQLEVEESTQIWADRNMTMTIFRNLINNALKFTPEGGSVALFASEMDGMVFAGVKDTGVGIPKEKLEQLFTLGEKKSTYGTSGEKGLGLGLQLVYEFIELNKGEIKVESELGHGTTFTVRLPSFKSEMSAMLVS